MADHYWETKVEMAHGEDLTMPNAPVHVIQFLPFFLFCKAIYIIARISMLLHIFAITINRNALHEVPCTQLTFMSKCTTLIRNSTLCVIINLPLVCDALGTVASSLILVLRTRAVWRQDIKITILMGVLLLGQIAVWSQSALSSTSLVGHAHPLIGFSH